MWQPSRRQSAIIWPVAILPVQPPPLPMGLDDDGDAVAEHDMLEAAYLQARQRSSLTRVRMDLKNGADPFDLSTQRQLLVGLVAVGALVAWQLDSGRAGTEA